MTTRGIDIRQNSDRIIFRVSLKDIDGAKVVSGTTELRVYRVNDDGTLDVLDWTTFGFVAPGSGTPDDETTMTHRVRRDSGGTDENTGIWTAVLSTLTNFTVNQVYIAQVTNSGAFPESQEREFQFGGAVDDYTAAIFTDTDTTIPTFLALLGDAITAVGDAVEVVPEEVISFDCTTIADESLMPKDSLYTVIMAMLHHSITGINLTIYQTDGVTEHIVMELTTNPAAVPIVGINDP